MPTSLVGRAIDDLETPALLLDLDALDHNIALMARTHADHGKAWRPHAKAFKTPAIAHRLLRAGATGLTVAKVSEAEVMVAGGVADLLIAHLVVGPGRADRLAALQRSASVKATVDHPDQLPPLAEAARRAGVEIPLLVDVDLGMNRAGVPSAAAAAELAGKVANTQGLQFVGVMGYEGHTLALPDPAEKEAAVGRAIARLTEAVGEIGRRGLPCSIVSAGGSGSYQITARLAGPTELQAGGGIFACDYYTRVCHVRDHRPAIALLATVVSLPAPGRAILDIGRKSVSDYRTPPRIADLPGSAIAALSAEHATVTLPADSPPPRIGQKLRVIPGYSDLTFALHDEVFACRHGRVEAHWPLWARGHFQ